MSVITTQGIFKDEHWAVSKEVYVGYYRIVHLTCKARYMYISPNDALRDPYAMQKSICWKCKEKIPMFILDMVEFLKLR